MMNRRSVLAFFLIILAATFSFAAEFDNLLEKGEFFNEKGSAYASDAVKALEQARDTDPARAKTEGRFVAAIAKAYIGVFRYSEAYMAIEELGRTGKQNEKTAALLDYLLNETGSGRLRISTAAPLRDFTAGISPLEEGRLDVAARKSIDKLKQYLLKPRELGPEGITLLIPEGKYKVEFPVPIDDRETRSINLEIWAGDQLEQRVLALYPEISSIRAVSGNRTVGLSWPPLEGAATYRLYRLGDDSKWAERYSGEKVEFTDGDVPPEKAATYRLYSLDKDGVPLAMASMSAWASRPVAAIKMEASIESDLTVAISWTTDSGALDRLKLIMKTETAEKTLFELKGDEIVRSGEVNEGPLELKPSEQTIKFRVEAWIEGSESPAAFAEKEIVVPAEVARIEEVAEEVGHDRITVEWSTVPRDALAQGYAIYVTGKNGIVGELVDRVQNAHAREFSYVPKEELEEGKALRHFVLPYVGDRFLWFPAEPEAKAEIPTAKNEKRAKAGRHALADLSVSWDPYPGATRYLARVDDNEFVVNEIYLEMSGLQSKLMGKSISVKILAVLGDGKTVPILSLNLGYEHYPR